MSIQEEIKAFVDGELSPEMTDSVRHEIDRDPALAQQVAHFRLMGDEIRAMAVEPQIVGAEEVLQKVQPRSLLRRLALIAVPLSIAIIVAVVFPVFGQAKYAAKRWANVDKLSQKRFADTAGEDSNSAMMADSAAAAPQAPADLNRAPAAGSPGVRADVGGRAVGGIQDDFRFGTRTSRITNSSQPSSATGSHWYAPGAKASPALSAGGLLDQTVTLKGTDVHRSMAKATPSPSTGRMVVENGTIGVIVDDVSRAQSDATRFARTVGGFASNSSLQSDPNDETSSSQITLRVPVTQFEATMEHLKLMAKSKKDLLSVQTTGQDVTAQYADTNARLKVLRAEEDSYVGMLRNVRHLEDVLTVKDRLSDVRQQIESLQAQASSLRDTSALSTIDATFQQRAKKKLLETPDPDPAPQGWADSAWTDAKSGMAGTTQTLGVWSIYLFVYSPIWLPLAFLGWLGARRFI